MINTTSLFLHSYFLCVYFSISIICEYHPDENSYFFVKFINLKFKTPYLIM